MTAGLAAYFIRLAQLGKLVGTAGTPVDRSVQGIKAFIISKAYSRFGTDRKGIYNNAYNEQWQWSCQWNPDNAPQRLFRRDSAPKCVLPASALLTPSGVTPAPTSVPLEKQGPNCHNADDYPDAKSTSPLSNICIYCLHCMDGRSVW